MTRAKGNSAARREIQRLTQENLAKREGRNTGRGLLAAELVRDWTPEQRRRIRMIALCEFGDLELVKLIDQINEEER